MLLGAFDGSTALSDRWSEHPRLELGDGIWALDPPKNIRDVLSTPLIEWFCLYNLLKSFI